jgi:hypothetical protein
LHELPEAYRYNTLLFDALRDSCTDGACYNTKLTKNVERQIAANPKLVQIATEWGTRGDGTVLGRNRHVALNLATKSAKSKKPLSAYQKPCKHMSEAIVVDGTERGRITKVCAEQIACAICSDSNRRGSSSKGTDTSKPRRRYKCFYNNGLRHMSMYFWRALVEWQDVCSDTSAPLLEKKIFTIGG